MSPEDRATLQSLVDDLKAAVDEADRRAGAAERELAKCRADLYQISRMREKMKEQWGVHRNVSFDAVWAHAVILKKQTDHLLDDLVVSTTDAQGFKDYAAKSDLRFSNMIEALTRARFPA